MDFGRGHHQCRGSIGLDAFYTIARMDNATGLWGQPLRYPFVAGQQMGNAIYTWNGDQPYQRVGRCLHPNDQNYNFKIGHYVVATTHRLDYDSVTYGKRWINITKNHLVGYHKSVLRLPFEETSGVVVHDRSYTWNGGSAGDPVSDYNNDGAIVGNLTRITDLDGRRSLRFPGTAGNYVNLRIGSNVVDDFDVGNYMTVSAWVRTRATPDDNKGLVMIDEFSDTWKLLLYMRGNGIAFGVRHRPDPVTGAPVYSRLDLEFQPGSLADGRWHLVTGTYNRFEPNGRRIKLYIDGRKVMEGAGHDLPILRGENQLVVGKYSVAGFFQGDIDDVGLFNYAMTGAQVGDLWRKRGAP
jgi:hypothetical protein